MLAVLIALFLAEQQLPEWRALESKAALLEQATHAHPTDAHAWYELGRTFAEIAGLNYRQLLTEVPPDSGYALVVRGDSFMHRQQYRFAFAAFRQALSKNPNFVSARSAIAEIYQGNGHPDWAARERGLLAALDCSAHKLECDSLHGRYRDMLAATGAAHTPEALYWRGEAYTGLSYQAFTQLVKLPPSPELYKFRAGLEYEAGHRMQVVENLKKAVRLAPDDRDLERQLAMALGAARDFAGAYDLALRLLRNDPNSPELTALAGDALLNEENAAAAVPLLEKSLAADPGNLMTHSSLARAYMKLGQPALAIPHLERASSIDRDGSLAYQLANAYRQTNRPELARHAMEKSQQLSRKAAEAPEPDIVAPE